MPTNSTKSSILLSKLEWYSENRPSGGILVFQTRICALRPLFISTIKYCSIISLKHGKKAISKSPYITRLQCPFYCKGAYWGPFTLRVPTGTEGDHQWAEVQIGVAWLQLRNVRNSPCKHVVLLLGRSPHSYHPVPIDPLIIVMVSYPLPTPLVPGFFSPAETTAWVFFIHLRHLMVYYCSL